ncbi:hypothetical protein ACEPAG_9405 [Sanghuangporus baumii]
MASIAEQLDLLPQVVSDTRTTNVSAGRFLEISSNSFLLRSCSELELVWKARWTAGNVLFILNRYPVFFISVFLFVYMFDYDSPYHLSVSISNCIRENLIDMFASGSCVVSNYVEAWSMLVFIIPVQVILILRTLALWGQNRKICVLLYSALLATDSTILVSITLVSKSLSFENRPIIKPILGCYGILNEVSTSHTIPSWIALIVFDTVVFVLTLIRVDNIRRAKKDRSLLLNILFRDGIIFYVIMLASSVANLALYASLPLHRRGLIISLIPLLRTVMSVCTARLILNLRSVARHNGRPGRHWALGELDDDIASSPALSRTTASATAVASSSATKHSFTASNGPRQVQGDTERNVNFGPDIVDESMPDMPANESWFGSPMPPIVVSVHTVEEEHRDGTPGEMTQPSSFRMSVLNRFTSTADYDANSNMELRELRPNRRSDR